MADLESALYYILQVEVSKFSVLEGQRLAALKKFMAVLAQVSRTLPSLVRQPHTTRDQCASLKQAPGQPLPQELAVGLDTWTRGCPSLLWAATLRSGPSSCQPRTTRDNPLPPPRPVQGGGWDPGPDALGIFPAGSACLSPLPQAEPGVQPLTPCCSHWESRTRGPQ